MATQDDGDYGVPAHIIKKGKTKEIRIGLNEYHGKKYLDLREFYDADGEMKPSPKGVTLSMDLYPELLRGVLLLGEMIGADVNKLLDAEDQS